MILGVIRLTIVKAENIVKMDSFQLSDPYCVIKFGFDAHNFQKLGKTGVYFIFVFIFFPLSETNP